MATNDPLLQRRRLRDRLRRLRENSGLTQLQVAEAMEWSPSKVIRIETGTVGVSVNDLRMLIAQYGVTDSMEINELITMARLAKGRPWWDRYMAAGSRAFLRPLAYESSASEIRNFEPLFIPELLRTEEYASELYRWTEGIDNVEERTDLTLERQERLLRPGGPMMHFIFDEGAILREVAGPSAMRSQIRRLMDLEVHRNITIGVIPFEAGLSQKFATPYTLYQFADPEVEGVLYLESEDVIREGGRDELDGSFYLYYEDFFSLEQKTHETANLLEHAFYFHDSRSREGREEWIRRRSRGSLEGELSGNGEGDPEGESVDGSTQRLFYLANRQDAPAAASSVVSGLTEIFLSLGPPPGNQATDFDVSTGSDREDAQ
ncbi:Scr1 family TA system antitoxin-like transcriptional regulator [Streptomyces canus]|uniref:helix-turn-helix domain-containing protein n=1 Tax=Streptomyces canus TaxID=58343 RepID=UPI0036EDE776